MQMTQRFRKGRNTGGRTEFRATGRTGPDQRRGSFGYDSGVVRSLLGLLVLSCAISSTAKTRPPTHAQLLRGAYDRYRANNKLISYALDIRVDPAGKTLAGKNTIRFRMVQ